MQRLKKMGMHGMVLACCVWSACASQSSRTAADSGGEILKEDPDFDPLILLQSEEEVPEPVWVVPGLRDSDILSEAALKADTTQEPLTTMIQGYRVQIYALQSFVRATEIYDDALTRFEDYRVYLEYTAPFYKIRVGDFISQYEADRFRRAAMRAGYRDAWVIRTKIYKYPDRIEFLPAESDTTAEKPQVPIPIEVPISQKKG